MQLETLFNNITAEGLGYLKVLLLEEEALVSNLNLDFRNLSDRKLSMKPNKDTEELRELDIAERVWCGRVNGVKTDASPETISAVNDYLQDYSKKQHFIKNNMDLTTLDSDLFFGVPVAKYTGDFKVFKKELLKKVLTEPKVMQNYLNEYISSLNGADSYHVFGTGSALHEYAKNSNKTLFKQYETRLSQCVVVKLTTDVTKMIEKIISKSAKEDREFNEGVWRDTLEYIPVFHNQYSQYMYYFLSLFMVKKPSSVLPKALSVIAVIALIRKVEEELADDTN